MHYVIIGNSAASVAAIEAIRKIDLVGHITVISDEPYHTYSRPMISHYLEGKTTKERMVFRAMDFYERYQVQAMLGVKAVEITKSTVILEDGREVSYDKLLLATGSVPFIPPIKGLNQQDNVFTFTKFDDALALEQAVLPNAKVVVVGAGLIGLKAAEGLVRFTNDITVVELSDRILASILDAKSASMVQNHLTQKGLKIHLQNAVKEVSGDGKVQKVILQDGQEIACDILIIAIGVRPNVALANTVGIKVNRGIAVNEWLQTSIENIYAAGDCTEIIDVSDGVQKVLALWPNAMQQGEIAGTNIAGGQASFHGGFPMNAISFFGMRIVTAGVINPNDTTHEVIYDTHETNFKKIVLLDDCLVGYILINDIKRASFFNTLIRDKVKISSLTEKII